MRDLWQFTDVMAMSLGTSQCRLWRRPPGRSRHPVRRKRRFTLIELLVVIAIIGILASLLIPGLTRARRNAMKVQCSSNLRQIGTSLYMFADDHHGYLPPGPDYPNGLSTRHRCVYQAPLPTKANLAEALGEYFGLPPTNTGSGWRVIKALQCPARSNIPADPVALNNVYFYGTPFRVPYRIIPAIGPFSPFGGYISPPPSVQLSRLGTIYHGSSSIWLVMDMDYDPVHYAYHDGAPNILFADGHVSAYPLIYGPNNIYDPTIPWYGF